MRRTDDSNATTRRGTPGEWPTISGILEVKVPRLGRYVTEESPSIEPSSSSAARGFRASRSEERENRLIRLSIADVLSELENAHRTKAVVI